MYCFERRNDSSSNASHASNSQAELAQRSATGLEYSGENIHSLDQIMGTKTNLNSNMPPSVKYDVITDMPARYVNKRNIFVQAPDNLKNKKLLIIEVEASDS